MKKLVFFFFILAVFAQVACKKNADSGPPVVTDVRTPNPAEADSTFTQAMPGTLIVIQGHGFSGLQAVYFNDTSAYFNPAYATDNNIILSIPSYAQTKATMPNAPSNIRIVTGHGSTSYTFTLTLHAPVITSVAFDNTGQNLIINGSNLVGVQKITFPVPSPDTALSYKVDTSWRFITVKIPPGVATHDSIRVYCTFGVASFPYPPPMVISSVSNENALAGDTITLTGSNFIGISSVTFPGGLAATAFKSTAVNSMWAVVPSGITAPDSLRVYSPSLGSTATAPQLFDSYITHPSPGYLSTFDVQYNTDNTGFVGWTGGYAAAPASAYPNGTGGVAYLLNGGPVPGNTGNGGNQGNPGFVQLNDVPWVSNTGASIANYSLKFEVYVAAPLKAGAIYIMVGDWYAWKGYVARWEPETGGNTYQPSGWTTVTIPLTQFVTFTGGGTTAMTNGKVNSPNTDGNTWDLQDWPTGGVPAVHFTDYPSTALCFELVNDQATPAVPIKGFNVAIDNVRIVQGQ